MRNTLILLIAAMAAACGGPDRPAERPGRPLFVVAGNLSDPALVEASGLARSLRDPTLLWVVNDGGSDPYLHAIDSTGLDRGRVRVGGADNVDWEDLASFREGGDSYLLVADIGDNEAKREFVTLYLVAEPAPGDDGEARVGKRIDFRYPDGARDAEAAAVDPVRRRVLVLSKRDIPPRLYAVPMDAPAGEILVADSLGTIRSLPAPTRRDIEEAPERKDWHWQPTAMDLSPDGRLAAILTYRAIYLYERRNGPDPAEALSGEPVAWGLGNYREAEAIAFSASGESLFVTIEKRHAPLLRIDLPESAGAAADARERQVTVMSFNVENLFDTVDDPSKNDETFLPIAAKRDEAHKAQCAAIEVERWREQCLYWDWSEEILEKKLSVVADAILQVNDGRGPDIVALQEVENRDVLERLRTGYLAAAGYGPSILLEGEDARGIDVAFLSRLELAEPAVLHRTEFEGVDPARVADTRGILEATFVLPGGGLMTGFAVHFPAPFHPISMRETAYAHLNALRGALPPTRPAFAAGDFNTTSREMRETEILDEHVRPFWTIAHEAGCEGCRGTSYYAPADDWSFLDMILWSPATRGENATWALRAESVRIASDTAPQVTAEGTPARFELPGGSGVSDHWPLVATFESE